jgi:hypothetical protein
LDKKDLEEVNEYECLIFEKYTEPL